MEKRWQPVLTIQPREGLVYTSETVFDVDPTQVSVANRRGVRWIAIAVLMLSLTLVRCNKGPEANGTLSKKGATTPTAEIKRMATAPLTTTQQEPTPKTVVIPAGISVPGLVQLAATHKDVLNGRKLALSGVYQGTTVVYTRNRKTHRINVFQAKGLPRASLVCESVAGVKEAAAGDGITVSGTIFASVWTDFKGRPHINVTLKNCTATKP